MSQKNAKRLRKLESRMNIAEATIQIHDSRLDKASKWASSIEVAMQDTAEDAFEQHLLRARYTAECKEHARDKAHADRRMRRILEAEEAARSWKAVAYGALVTAIIVLIIAIAAVKAKAIDPVPQETTPENELAILIPETSTHSEDDTKKPPILVTSLYQIMDSDKVDSKFYDVPLDADLQQLLWEACEESGIDMSLALAVIWEETDYRNIIGDDGASFGYMQVQKKWHEDRMARLDVTDLMDPASNFRVGCDYLAELLEIYPLANALAFYNSGDPALRPYCERVMDYMEMLEGGWV